MEMARARRSSESVDFGTSVMAILSLKQARALTKLYSLFFRSGFMDSAATAASERRFKRGKGGVLSLSLAQETMMERE